MTNTSLLKGYRAVVVGAGPGGVAALANLLDANVHPVLWVDPLFQSGRLSQYPLVPSNTNVQLFVDYALASSSLAKVVQEIRPSPVAKLQALDPQSTCSLAVVVEMVCGLTEGIRRHLPDKVHFFQGWATGVVRDDKGWQVKLGLERNSSCAATCKTLCIIFATGCHPTPTHPSWAPHQLYASPEQVIQEISLETALHPPTLASALAPSDTVAVVGSSHSAVLCLKNLVELASPPRKILHYYREPLKYAVYKEGWILYDNTGLKGQAAQWAREVLEPGKVPFIESHHLGDAAKEKQVYEGSMGGVSKVIYAIGFRRNPLPEIVAGAMVKQEELRHNSKNGKLLLMEGGVPLPGLFGYGIAFPEETVDPEGNRECAVGLWKFMRYLKVVGPGTIAPEIMALEERVHP